MRKPKKPPVNVAAVAALVRLAQQENAGTRDPRCPVCGAGLNFTDGQAAAHMALHA